MTRLNLVEFVHGASSTEPPTRERAETPRDAAIGFLQENGAERAVMALRSMTAPRARVVRKVRGAAANREGSS